MKRAALLFLLALGAGCQRKAPGPDECRALAYHLFGITRERDLADRRVRSKVDEQITECLVTPYDYELVRCLEAGMSPRNCEYSFVARRPPRSTPSVPHWP